MCKAVNQASDLYLTSITTLVLQWGKETSWKLNMLPSHADVTGQDFYLLYTFKNIFAFLILLNYKIPPKCSFDV